MNLRISRRSAPRHPRNMITLAEIALVVIMIPPYLLTDSETKKQPTEQKDMNKLDHVVKSNINNKDQCNVAIEYEPDFDSKFSLSSGTKDPLPVVTVRL